MFVKKIDKVLANSKTHIFSQPQYELSRRADKV